VGIYSHESTFAGLPVVSWDEYTSEPAGEVAWRLDSYGSGASEFERAFAEVLDRTGDGGPFALVVGDWGGSYERPFPYEFLIENVDRLTGLRALMAADLTGEECEISWIKQNDVTPLLRAFPRLETLWVRGADGLALTPLRHEGLRELVFQSGGLPAEVVRAVGACDLPNLEHLELWLGVANYGGDARVEDLAPILAGRSLPALIFLGLCNAGIADEIAVAVATAPVVTRLAVLDLSMGVMGDAGGEALLAGQPLTHLEALDLRHHYMSAVLARRIGQELPGVRVDTSDEQDEEEWGRYPEVSE